VKCLAIKVKDGHIERCVHDAVIDGLCAVHYALAVRLIQRHNRLSDLPNVKEAK
jgi:hypothetical protein